MNSIYKNFFILFNYFILGSTIISYFISGLVFSIQDYDMALNCEDSNLGEFSIVSLLFFWISICFKLYDYNYVQNNNKIKDYPLIIYIIFFIVNLILFIWGYIDIFILSKDCEIYNKNLWIFNLVSSSINLAIVLRYIFYLSRTINTIKNSLKILFNIKKIGIIVE